MAIFNVGATGGGGSNGGLPSYYIYDEYMTEVPSGFFSPYDYFTLNFASTAFGGVTFPSKSYGAYSYLSSERFNGGNRTLRIELPNVTSINQYAFANCVYLSEVILPNYVVEDSSFFQEAFIQDINLQYLSVKQINYPIYMPILTTGYSNYDTTSNVRITSPMKIKAESVDWVNFYPVATNSSYISEKQVILDTPIIHMSLLPLSTNSYFYRPTVAGLSGYCSQLSPITTSSDYAWPNWLTYLSLSGLTTIPQYGFGNGNWNIRELYLPDVISIHSQFRTSSMSSLMTLVCPKLSSLPSLLLSDLYVSSFSAGYMNVASKYLFELGISSLASQVFTPGFVYAHESTSTYWYHMGLYILSLPNLKNIATKAFVVSSSASYRFSTGGTWHTTYSYFKLDFTLDLRGVSSVPTAAANWLSVTSIYDFKIYVPRSLYSDFYNAPNWSTTAIRNALISV